MNTLTPAQLDLVADACEFYFLYLAHLATNTTGDEARRLADNADMLGEIADVARNASEVQ